MKHVHFLKSSLIYWLGRMGSRTVSFFLLPIYTAYIIPADWGILHLLMISGDLVFMLVSFEIQSALYRYWALTKTEDEKRRLAGLGLVFPVLVSSLVFLPLYIYADSCARLIGIEGHGNYIRVLLVTEQIAVMLNIFQAEMRLRNEAKLFACLDIIQNFGSASLNIFFVVVCGWGIWGILLGTMLTFLMIVIALAPRFLRRCELNLDLQLLKKLVLFSLPLVPSALAMGAVHNIDRYFLQFMQGAESVGIYSIGYKFGTLVKVLILGPFLLIWEPKSYELAMGENASVKIGKIFTFFLALLLFMAVGLTGASREIVEFMTAEKYHTAWKVIPLVAFSYVLFGMDSIVRIGLLVHKRTNIIFLVVFLVCAINVVGNWLLIPRIGMLGAAWSTLITFAFLVGLDGILAHRYLRLAYEWKKLFILMGTAIVTVSLMQTIHVSHPLIALVFKGLLLCAYPLLLMAFGFINKDNIAMIREVLSRKKSR